MENLIGLFYFYLSYISVMSFLMKDNFLPNKLNRIARTLGLPYILDDEESGSIMCKMTMPIVYFLKELSNCKFCMGNWIGLIMCVPLAIVHGELFYLAWGFFSVSISKHFEH